MAVLNYKKYRLTEHAYERLEERFNIPRGEAKSWIRRFLENAEFKKMDHRGCELYALRNIKAVINPITRTVITIYYEDKKV